MELKSLYEELDKFGVPVSMVKTKDTVPPCIIFYREEDVPFYADGINYYNRTKLIIEIYTKDINLDLERKVEKLLQDQGFLFEKFHRFTDDEMKNLVLYEFII